MNIQKHKTEDYPYLFRTSAFSMLKPILFFLILIISGIYFIYNHKYAGVLVILFWMAISVLIIIEKINNRIIIKLNHNGIWTKRTKFLTWQKIKKINFIFTNNESDIELILKKGKKKIRVNVANVSKINSLRQLIDHFLDQKKL